jgi:N6-adenosine-specific RNA methylase IME4
MTQFSSFEPQICLFKNLVGEGNRLCFLENAAEYRLEYALIIQDNRGYRIVVKSFVTLLLDRRYKTLKGAKDSLIRVLELDRVKLLELYPPKWSTLFIPDDAFYYDWVRENMMLWRYKIKRKWPYRTETVGEFIDKIRGQFDTILIDPPWRFHNRAGKMAPEYKRFNRYNTMSFEEISNLPILHVAAGQSHLYLWVPNALLEEGMRLLKHWGFTYKTYLVWCKTRKDGLPNGGGVGFYFRNATEMVLFGIRGKQRTLKPGRRQMNILFSRKKKHSQKPEELYRLIEECSPGPYLELFARQKRPGWTQWGNEID